MAGRCGASKCHNQSTNPIDTSIHQANKTAAPHTRLVSGHPNNIEAVLKRHRVQLGDRRQAPCPLARRSFFSCCVCISWPDHGRKSCTRTNFALGRSRMNKVDSPCACGSTAKSGGLSYEGVQVIWRGKLQLRRFLGRRQTPFLLHHAGLLMVDFRRFRLRVF